MTITEPNPGIMFPTIPEVLARWGTDCVFCGRALTEKTATRDHLLPFSRGGSNDIANVVPACPPCNNDKGDKTPIEWLRENCPGRFQAVDHLRFVDVPDPAPFIDLAMLIVDDFPGCALTEDAARAVIEALLTLDAMHLPSSARGQLAARARAAARRIDRQGRKYQAARDLLRDARIALAVHSGRVSGPANAEESVAMHRALDALDQAETDET